MYSMQVSRKITILIPPLLIGLTVLQFIFVYQHERNMALEAHKAAQATSTDIIVTEPLPPILEPAQDDIDTPYFYCSNESRLADACIEIYSPVCGQVQVECITTPCPPVPETFSNSCFACQNDRVVAYTEGACTSESELGY